MWDQIMSMIISAVLPLAIECRYIRRTCWLFRFVFRAGMLLSSDPYWSNLQKRFSLMFCYQWQDQLSWHLSELTRMEWSSFLSNQHKESAVSYFLSALQSDMMCCHSQQNLKQCGWSFFVSWLLCFTNGTFKTYKTTQGISYLLS